MRFKKPELIEQLDLVPKRLQEIAQYADDFAVKEFGKEIIITRVFDKIDGPESGVHAAKRAIDIRVEHGNNFYFTMFEAEELVKELNQKFPRKDTKPTALLHRVPGSTFHIHVQVEK